MFSLNFKSVPIFEIRIWNNLKYHNADNWQKKGKRENPISGEEIATIGEAKNVPNSTLEIIVL